jgi:hypothetical protein
VKAREAGDAAADVVAAPAAAVVAAAV